MEKPDMNQRFDKNISRALRSKADEIAPSSDLLDRINADILNSERENISMNHNLKLRKMKPVLIASLVLILSAATCFAASQITSLIGTSSKAFDEFPTERQVEKEVNFVPDYVEEFSNGFTFKSASINNTQALDNEDNKVDENTGIAFSYTRENSEKGQLLTLNADPEMEGLEDAKGPNDEVISFGELDLTYSSVVFKVVPEGYVPTEEENQQMAAGSLWISYGSDQIESSNLQYVKWVKDGIDYNLMDNGYEIPKDEIIAMAKEVAGKTE